ncbi:MAG: hypothetical protein COU82_01570 [Candidatus Portnoybacteria bacterium CG10_big_fil_rev_8_21_14_0_10_38_18]|uniref:DUF11 domain-containing protein n=1 Tax=Candidatus Portnoybacteria bacterium CG10_big_fil_rev_8_21_14_0_10_38_18 TaxID=1974813 RepID=A0A2M8KC83_9BACT|nr:MAG: hypothetical protein COU82_01570 [Candidatus Portnoybacteria bacterium CG10_big_fil_rev_8_21_14_0_10_38_18]
MDGGEEFQITEINPQEPIYPQEPKPSKKRKGLISLFYRKNLPRTLFFLVVIFIVVAIGAIIWGRQSFSPAKVELSVKTSPDIASGKEVILTIEYTNDNRVNLNDSLLIINYPSGVFSSDGKEIHQEQRDLKQISKKSQGQESFRVRFVGGKGEFKTITAILSYQPQNINSRFEKSTDQRIEINSVLISIKIDGPENVISGQDVSYLIEYENKTNNDISNLRAEIAYSEDFKIKNTDPKPAEGTTNVWQINTLKAGEKKVIGLNGILQGEEGEDKALEVMIGTMENEQFLQYSRSEYSTKIAPSPLLLLVTLERVEEENCNLNPGQHLKYIIEFRNNTDVALKELILKAYLEDSVFDFKSLELDRVGYFDSRQNVITWGGGEVPKLNLLEPNESGSVNFTIDLKNPIPMNNYNDKNFQATVLSEIGTLTVPAKFAMKELKISREFSCKVNSQLDIKSKVYYNEPAPGIFNTGPLPPKVNELTTYTVHWQISNGSNDLENVRVSAVLPQGISWSNYYINKVSDSQVYYNERTKEVIWEIQKVPAGVGSVSSLYELIFQIGLTPSINQVGESPVLINESSAEGKDTFTQVILDSSARAVTTMIPDDPNNAYNKSRVVE